jgi:hypothetical protein
MSRRSIPDQLRRQATWCKRLGSPLYTHLLSCCAADSEAGGPLHDLLRPHEHDDEASVLPLRLMGAVHLLALRGQAPELAKFYPSTGGIADLDGAWEAFRSTVRKNAAEIRKLIKHPVQTNEVGRSGSLLGGFGLIAERTGLPLRLLEIGTSAGLNLRWDHYRYEWSGGAWGDPASRVCIKDVFRSGTPSIPSRIAVTERAGCDTMPVNVSDESGRLTLLSYTWADQLDRIHRLKAAIKIARSVPCEIERKHAADWLEVRLRKPSEGSTTVVFQSAFWQYVAERERHRIIRLIEGAGRRASPMAPVAWLRLEATKIKFQLRLRIYPGFKERIIATSRAHTPSVRWLLRAGGEG